MPDLNDDGYAEIGIYYRDWIRVGDRDIDGIYLFVGGEEIDTKPDMILEGGRSPWVHEGFLTAGDFNGDGVGDLVAGYWSQPPHTNGEVHLHFGGADFDSIADLVVSHSDYGGQYRQLGYGIGGVGDYNGDGADDIAAQAFGDVKLVMLAGNLDWEVGVPYDPPPVAIKYGLHSYLNPFNNSVTIEFSLDRNLRTKLEIFDIRGRRVDLLHDGDLKSGKHALNWEAPSAGLYFVTLRAGVDMRVRKIVCLK